MVPTHSLYTGFMFLPTLLDHILSLRPYIQLVYWVDILPTLHDHILSLWSLHTASIHGLISYFYLPYRTISSVYGPYTQLVYKVNNSTYLTGPYPPSMVPIYFNLLYKTKSSIHGSYTQLVYRVDNSTYLT